MLGQGSTTASMSGVVKDANNEALIGATVLALHTPTGVSYGTVTDIDGTYRLANLRIGGPYTITTTYVGYTESVQAGIMLDLGQKVKFDVELAEGGVTLNEVVVSAKAGTLGQNAGAETRIDAKAIDDMPTLGRNLNDFTRLTPQAKSTFGGGFSIAGANNRYNAIYIDGAVNNDVFGLAGNGQNGGQTGIAPVSIDIIDQIQVVVSPYDVSLGGFAGGGINAVTKSGTNEFQGTAYYFTQNESLAGKTNKTLADRNRLQSFERTGLDVFSSNLIGGSIGGPIIKDKLHFFVNAEVQSDETPQPFEFGEYNGDITEEQVQELGTFLQDEYGYDAGDYGSKVSKLDGVRLFGKLNYNINEKHDLVFRHQYTKAEQNRTNGSGRGRINFQNNGVYFPSITNSTALELNSRFSEKISNNLIIGYTSVDDDRDPIGGDFPNVVIQDANGSSLSFGSEAFSTANSLTQKTLTITDNLKYYANKHTLTIGTHNEFMSFNNLFIRQNFGFYDYDSLDDFYNNAAPGFYTRSYSLVDDVVGDGSAAAAEFSAMQLGFYIQDEFQVTNKLALTGGIRLDIPILGTDPAADSYFNDSTVVAISELHDLQGARSGQAPSGQLMWSPRVGFNYDVNGDGSTIIRGGFGVFTSRVPFVWPGGMYTNNGQTIGGFNNFQVDFPIEFIGNIDEQYTNPEFTVPSGQVDLFTEDFKYPQVFRTSFAVDKRLGNGWNASIEGIYTNNLNNVFYENVNSNPTVAFNWTNGGDNRPVYVNRDIDRTYTAVYLASNTNEGSSTNLTVSVDKAFDWGLNFMAAVSYGDAYGVFDGTSSQNSSQWRGSFNVDGRNNVGLGRSDFSQGTRIIGSAQYGINWTKGGKYRTGLSVFYEGQSGNNYSYVYDQRNLNGERGSTSRERSLIYVPASADDIMLVENNGVSAEDQWDALNTFIEEDAHLSGRRGQYAERNGSRTPFTHQLDLKITQDLGVSIGDTDNRLQLTLDIFNFTNLLNNEWGVIYNNPFAYELLNFEGYADDETTPTFSYTNDDLGNNRFGIADRASRWRGRIGIRYIFN